jgi:hypothetical protein
MHTPLRVHTSIVAQGGLQGLLHSPSRHKYPARQAGAHSNASVAESRSSSISPSWTNPVRGTMIVNRQRIKASHLVARWSTIFIDIK